MSQENKKKNFLFSLMGLFALVACLGGLTYAIFNYTKTGSSSTISVGKIVFDSNQTNTINLTNFVPINSNDVDTDTVNVGTATIRISGDTEYNEGVEYLVKAVDVHNTINNKTIPISIVVTYEESTNKTIGTADNDYYTNRGGNTSIYKLINGNNVTSNGEILVGYITEGQTGIDGVLTIKAYVDEDDIIVSDTFSGTTDKVVLTTAEWNSLKGNDALSFKINVEANEGVWVTDSSTVPTPTPAPIICQSATTLHTETCQLTTSTKGCRLSGYSQGATIEYGNLVSNTNLQAGDALDCNVDGTGYNQRFYYLRTLDGKAVLISYATFEGDDGQQNTNNYTYDVALTKLPKYDTQWTNVPTTYTHNGDNTVYAARFVTMDDLQTATGKTSLSDNMDLNDYQFLFESTGYANNGGRSTSWIEEVIDGNTTKRYRIHKDYVSVAEVASNALNTSVNCVRPVIEVPLNQINITVVAPTPTPTPTPVQYEVNFNTNGGSANPSSIQVNSGSTIGSQLPPNPTKEDYIFDGWYDGSTLIDANTVVTGTINAVAHWKPSISLATVSPSSFSVQIGNSQTITVSGPSGMESYTFSASNGKASVTPAGIVTGITTGAVDIIITGSESGATKTVNVNVTAAISQVYTIDFASEGGSTVSDVYHITANDKLGELPNAPTRAGYVFNGWYTAASDGTKVNEETIITGNATYHAQWDKLVCTKATALHTDGTNTFGTLPGNNTTISGGFAYDCDVNGNDTIDTLNSDNNNAESIERFYYLTTDSDGYAALIFYNNTHQNSGTLEYVCGADGQTYSSTPTSGPTGSELPTTSQWTNVSLHSTPRQLYNENGTTAFGNNTLSTASYSGKAARFATTQEITAATGVAVADYETTNILINYKYLFENLKVLPTLGGSSCRSNYWLENPKESGSAEWRIDGDTGRYRIGNANGGGTSKSATRPTIEVPTRLIEGMPIKVTVQFNTMGGSSVPSRELVRDSQLGTLPTEPTKSGHTFGGWYTTETNQVTEVDSTRVIHDNVIFYAKWVENVQNYHTVTLNLDGGSMPNNESTSIQVLDGDPVGNIAHPTKTDYIFDGWYLVDEPNHSSSYNTYIDSTHEVYSDEEYIASWIFDNYEAKIGSVPYETLTSAISAVPTNSQTYTEIVLLNDITATDSYDIAATKKIILNLNNHTILNETNNPIMNHGYLKIKNGTVRSNATKKGTINNEITSNSGVTPTLYIMDGARIENIKDRQAIYNAGDVYIEDGAVLLSVASQRATVHNFTSGANVYISGGTIIQTNANCERGAIENIAGSNVEITGGTIISNSSYSGSATGSGPSGIQNNGTLKIGTQDGAHDTSTIVIRGKVYGVKSSGAFEFYDGVIKGVTAATNVTGNQITTETSVNAVNGTETIATETYGTYSIAGATYNTLHYELQTGYYITYDVNAQDATISSNGKTIQSNTAIGSVPIPARTDYYFEGWYLSTDTNFQNNLGTDTISYVPTGAVTIVANWVQSVTLANISGGTSRSIVGANNTDTIVVSNASSIEQFTYSSGDPFVATVSSNGIITATGAGRTLITLTGNDSGNTKTLDVTVDLDNDTPTFDMMSDAMRVYFDNISNWADNQTDSNHTSYDTAMSANLTNYNCVNFNGDDRANQNTTTGTTFCDQPKQYDTGETGTINVYEYDYANSTRGSAATYVTNNNGKLYNFIPGRVYEWEKDGTSTTGKVYIFGERRIITIDNSPSDTFHQIRNVRDLGGIKVDTDGDGTIDGTIKYNKLYRGEKPWTGTGNGASTANTLAIFQKLGITHEMDLRAGSEPVTSEETVIGTLVLNDDTPSNTKTYEVKHYEINYTSDATYYALARKAVKDVMTQIVNAHQNNQDYSMYFHCRIGADRTGMLAYLLEGLLGAPNEERYRDYEMTVFFGIDERTRFYFNKGSNEKKFVYMKNAIKAADPNGLENVLSWYLKADGNNQTLINADMDLISDFQDAMIDFY